MKRFLLTILTVAPLAAVADEHDPIAERQSLMSDTRDALRPLIGMTRGRVDFDAETVEQSLAVFANTSEMSRDLFPIGTESGGETEAKDTIWSDPEGFQQGFVAFSEAVASAQAANIQSVEELQPNLQGVLKTCRDCHDGYRIETD
ncbi:MAG: cytochrome c [Pseudomonadota bacterium]